MTRADLSPRTMAVGAGVLYLAVAVFGIFGFLYVPGQIVVPGDPAATAANIAANRALFGAGMAAETLVVLTEVVLTALLYLYFRPVNGALSLIAAWARLGMTVVQGVNVLNHFVVLTLLGGATYLAAFEPAQVQALGLVFLDAHQNGVYLWQIFFGLHLVVLARLAWMAGDVPRILAALMGLGAFGYLGDSYRAMLAPESGILATIVSVLLVAATLGELGFAVWLIVRGGKRTAAGD